MNSGNALLLIFDGLGFNRKTAGRIIDEVWLNLPTGERKKLSSEADSIAKNSQFGVPDGVNLARASLYPISAEALDGNVGTVEATNLVSSVRLLRKNLGRDFFCRVSTIRRGLALRFRYAPWAAQMPNLTAVRNSYLTVPTVASGMLVGFEDLDPPIQGNSDTGHQQIGNFRMAPQTALRITKSINSGDFFKNELLNELLDTARTEKHLSFCFMVSGVRGDDGRVHSAWNHLEAFLELIFGQLQIPPNRVKMQAILDGRDCPGESSINAAGGVGDYLNHLKELLARYCAIECLAWVIGRNFAMDRDYSEENVRKDYLLLTKGVGQEVNGFDGVRSAIAEWHSMGVKDSNIPGMVVRHGGLVSPALKDGDVFLNLNFRSDRQRAKTASLLKAVSFLKEMSPRSVKPTAFNWIQKGPKLKIVTLANYHPSLVNLGAIPIFSNIPQKENLFYLYPKLFPGQSYSLVGESNKAAHMGFFIRGNRENPVTSNIERRTIIASTSMREKVGNDSEFWKTPGMRSDEVGKIVIERMSEGDDKLICANFSNCDMLGHLLPEFFDEALIACEKVDDTFGIIMQSARSNAFNVIVTSDHGNIENDSPAHTTNDVLTTIVPASGKMVRSPEKVYRARLFDIAWTLSELMGVRERDIIELTSDVADPELIGRTIGRLDDSN